ncbi:unnamed protein product [Spodoptera exigua]|uniref:ATP synthase-coupling factor 6, mitochondrial n=1 Tax=Spodoptera exigua TaxID=7107 RepID=A0A922M0R1_SPOEX|nr:hypothetical protein HF086_018367 [Spodoptera exigua]CAH0695285.1 unnamed protein product [Spodoptera exigua]
MLISKISRSTRCLFFCSVTRNKGTSTDPVQQLFVEKIREYAKRSADGKLVDPNPIILKELERELGKLETQYGGGPGVDMTAFPTFKFDEAKVDPIDDAIAKKSKSKQKSENKKGGPGK